MKVEREDFERSFERFEMPEPALERLVERRERRRRRERIEAGIAALVVVAATAAVLARGFVVTPVPEGPSPSVFGPCTAAQLRASATTERVRPAGARARSCSRTSLRLPARSRERRSGCSVRTAVASMASTSSRRRPVGGRRAIRSRKGGRRHARAGGPCVDPPVVVELVRNRGGYRANAAGGRWRDLADRRDWEEPASLQQARSTRDDRDRPLRAELLNTIEGIRQRGPERAP